MSLAVGKKLDLNNVPAIDKSAGMNPETVRLREEQRKVQQQKVEEIERQMRDTQEQHASLLEKIQQERASRPPAIPTPTPPQPPSNDSGGSVSRPPSISDVKVVHTGSNSLEIRVTPQQAGMIHYVVLPSDAPAPNPLQVKDGLDGNGEPAFISATQEVVSGREADIHVGELEESSSYTVYIVAEGNSLNLSRISRLQVETTTSEYFARLDYIFDNTYDEASIHWYEMTRGQHYAEGIVPNTPYRVIGRLVNKQGKSISAVDTIEITAEAEDANGTISNIIINEDGTFEFTYQSAEQGSENNNNQDSFKILINGYPTSSFWTNTY